MSDDDRPRKPIEGEVLPPVRQNTPVQVGAPTGGIPLFNRIGYRERRRELEEYLAMLKAGNAVVREIAEARALRESFERGLVRTERLDDLRQIERFKIDAELDDELESALQRHRDAQANALAHRARLADLEADAIESERRLAAVKSPATPPEPPPKQSPSERMSAEMVRLRKQEKDMIAALVGEFDNEDDLPGDDRELIRDVKLATRNQIQNLIDEMSR